MVLLLKCNLTVSVGHINGIIFYANIVQVNKANFFPAPNTPSGKISTFIAWLNLDLGIETCFYENMNSYSKVWLQFVFPVYLWIIIGMIITIARISGRMSKLIGSNSVPVLATLFLLCYAKLLRTIIAAVSFTFIHLENGSLVTVWLLDGSVKYFHSFHIVLVLVALAFAVLYILPLTLLVLLAPCLQTGSHYQTFKWVNRLKPFLDAYQGPYSDKFRFWAGILLVARLGLFSIYAANFQNDRSMCFFWTIITSASLAIFLIWRKVYRHKLANFIEFLSLANVAILCLVNWLTTATAYRRWRLTREYSTFISVVITILIFLGIVLYQLIQAVYPTLFPKQNKAVSEGQVNNSMSAKPVTFSVVGLDESNQLKEPLLDSS